MSRNGNSPQKKETTPEQLAAAIESEAGLAQRAAEIRGDATELDRELFLKLAPLMREKIPEGFVSEVTAGEGKPYPSKGVRSLQVQIDRMDAIWTPLWWGWNTEWIEPQLAEVMVWVGDVDPANAMVRRFARGGMNRGSTVGNHYKGTETNAAKLAFARLGVGHEIYLGAADFDPDTDEDAAKAQEQLPLGEPSDSTRKLPADKIEPLERAIKAAGLEDHLPMKLRSFGVESLKDLTVDQAVSVYEWAQGEVVSG